MRRDPPELIRHHILFSPKRLAPHFPFVRNLLGEVVVPVPEEREDVVQVCQVGFDGDVVDPFTVISAWGAIFGVRANRAKLS